MPGTMLRRFFSRARGLTPLKNMGKMSAKAWVVMPLYIYPLTDATWSPLYNAIAAYPDVNFLVIVNPNSGPGGMPLPSHDYIREVPKLNAFPNVHTVGYIRIDYCKQPLEQSFHDIKLYADWKKHHDIPGLFVRGIYVDETPNHVSRERGQYLDALREYIKASEDLGDRLVVHNPGTPPEGDLALFGSPDVVCICEEPHKLYSGAGTQGRLEQYSPNRTQIIYQISGIPAGQIADVVQDLCKRGKYIFATDLVDDFYESFGPSWGDFVASVRKSNKIG